MSNADQEPSNSILNDVEGSISGEGSVIDDQQPPKGLQDDQPPDATMIENPRLSAAPSPVVTKSSLQGLPPAPLISDEHKCSSEDQASQLSKANSRFMKYVEKQEKFFGVSDKHLNWERTIQRSINNYEQFDKLSELIKVSYVASMLDGAALSWLCHKEDEASLLNQRPFQTLSEILHGIKLEFGIRNTEEKAFHYLTSLEPININVQEYLSEFTPQLYAAEGMSDAIKARFFKKGLHPAITKRMKLKLLDKESNVNLSKNKEAAHQAYFEYKLETKSSTNPGTNDNKRQKPDSPLKPKESGFIVKIPYNKDHRCDFCHTLGHLTIDCRKRIAHEKDSTTGRS